MRNRLLNRKHSTVHAREGFEGGLAERTFSLPNYCFLHVLQKMNKDEFMLVTNVYYFLFNTFFSQVSDKKTGRNARMVNWSVVEYRICPGVTFGQLTLLLRLWTNIVLLVGRYVPTKVIRVRNKDKPWFDNQYRRAFGLKQKALRWARDRSQVHWEEFVSCQVRAN